MSHRTKQLLYHFTSVENINEISSRGILSRWQLEQGGLLFSDVAARDILEGRAKHKLDRMVPFHFFAKNPFDYKVWNTYPEKDFCLLTVRRAHAAEHGWKIIPQHPLAGHGPPRLLDWAEGMNAIDWQQIDRADRDYDDQKCRLACMAEALSPRAVPLSDVAYIYVPDERVKKLVLDQLDRSQHSKLRVNENMFPRKR